MLEIEVVGERCRRKNEPRPSRDDDDGGDEVIPSRPPATPEDAIIRSAGKDRRPVSTNGSRAYLTSASSWRHKQFHRQGNAFSGPLGYERDAVSRGETGMKIKISYVDRKGRVRATPTTSHTDRPVSSTPASYREQESPIAQDYPELSEANDLCGWRSTSPNFSDRLYRPQRSPSAKDRAFSAVLSRSKKKLEIHGISSFRGPDSAKEEKEVPLKIGSPASMPSLRRSSGPTQRARSATGSGAVETNGSGRSHSGANIHTVSDTSRPGETFTTEMVALGSDKENPAKLHEKMVTLGSDKENPAKLHEKSVSGGQWGIPVISELVGTMATRRDSKGSCSPEARHVTFSEDLTDRRQPPSFSSIANTSSHTHEASGNSYIHAPTAPEISNGHILTPSMDFHSQVRTASACSNGHLPTASVDLHSQVRTASASSNGHLPTASVDLHSQARTASASSNGHLPTASVDLHSQARTASASSNGHLPTASVDLHSQARTASASSNGHLPTASVDLHSQARTASASSNGHILTAAIDLNNQFPTSSKIPNGHLQTPSAHSSVPTPSSSLSSSGPLRTPSSNDTRWFDLTDGPSRKSMNVNGRLPTVAAIPNRHIPSPSPHSSGPKLTSFLRSGGTLRTSSADSNSHRQGAAAIANGHIPTPSTHSSAQTPSMPFLRSGGTLRTSSADSNSHRQAATAISNGHIPTHSPHASLPTPTSSLSSSGPLRTPSTSAKSTSVLTSKSHGGRLHHTRPRQQSSQRPPNVRPFTTTSAERRLNSRIPVCVKERLRSLWYSSSRRRANSATTERWKWAAGMGDGARGGRGRNKLNAQQDEKVVRDENAPPSESKMYRKFRLVGWLTLTLIRLKAAIVINSQDRTERSAAEIQWRTLFGEQGTQKLAFDKSRFSREKISTKIPTWALRVVDVRPENRTEQDCRRLHTLLRGLRSFDKFTEEIQLNLCRALTYSCLEETRVVLRRGHIGNYFYFIFSGSVFVNVQEVDSNGESFIKTEAILGRGDSFGELALLQDIRRTATVTVRETCELLAVDKDVFSQICPQIFEKELMEKRKFIHRLTLFNPKVWTQDALKTLCIEAQIQEYKINKIVVDNNRTDEWLYICMEGKCQVIRRLSEEEEEEEEEEAKEAARKRGRAQSMAVLSQEIIELLSATAKTQQTDQDEEQTDESSQEKLLASLNLEYAKTGKRDGIFMHEVAEEARKKAQKASSAPNTLTALMAQQQKDGKARVVYLNIGSLQAEEYFDLNSLIKAQATQSSSNLMLVSSGAKLLRVRKTTFIRLASLEAMEYTKTMISKQSFPSDAAIMESYKTMVTWNAYKVKVLGDVIRSRDLRSAPLYRGPERETIVDPTGRLSPDRNQPPSRPATGRDRKGEDKKRKAKVTPTQVAVDEKDDAKKGIQAEDRDVVSDVQEQEVDNKSEGSSGGETREEKLADDNEERTVSVPPTATQQKPPAIFPVVEVDTTTYPPSPRIEPPLVDTMTAEHELCPHIAPAYGIGPAPTAVIIHRQFTTPGVYRPYTTPETKFFTHKEKDKPAKSRAAQTTRFLLTTDVNNRSNTSK